MNYTVKEVARILRVCDRTVRNFIARGDLPAVRVGRKRIVSPRSVETFCVYGPYLQQIRDLPQQIPEIPMYNHKKRSFFINMKTP